MSLMQELFGYEEQVVHMHHTILKAIC